MRAHPDACVVRLLDRAEQASEWLSVLAALDKQRLNSAHREEHGQRLDAAGDRAIQALCQDPYRLPVGGELASLGSHARGHLRQAVRSAGQAAAQSGDVNALSAYLQWSQSQFSEERVTALITAVDTLADEIGRRGRDAENESGLKTLEELGSSRAAEVLGRMLKGVVRSRRAGPMVRCGITKYYSSKMSP